MRRTLLALTTLLMALAACSSLAPDATTEEPAAADSAAEAPHWGYEGQIGPDHWADLDPQYATCATGRQQSPIDLPGEPAPTLADVTFDYHQATGQLFNNGHTIQVDYGSGSRIEIDGRAYELRQFHFHAPSEHTVAGASYPIELHLVHQNPDDKSYAVVGVFIEEGAENAALASFWSDLPAETDNRADVTVNAADLLPTEQTLYRYHGSFTTPPCTEGVTWSVMRRPIQMSAAQIAAFTALFSGNDRPLQPLLDQDVQTSDEP